MSEKYETLAIFTAIVLLLFVMFSGCSQQAPGGTQSPPVPAYTAPSAPIPSQAEPNVPSSEGLPSVPTGAPQANNTPPSTAPPSPNGGPQPAPANGTNASTQAPAPPEPQQITVAVPETPTLGNAHFIVTIPQNTAADSKVYLEAYNIGAGTWKAYEMTNNETLLGWNVVIDLGTSGGVDNSDNTFHYRYSISFITSIGKYTSAEKFVFDSPNAYRTRPVADVAGKFVQDQVTEWKGNEVVVE